jgi:alanyl-tRNA synthetase
MMTSTEIRDTFLAYFRDRGHRVVSSSPLVLPRDPTLLFANAGMNQFKDVFLGREQRDYTRAASAQKCLRVSGKHNDLEEVGRTARHHTFFEMLGNFSFGDYFKEDTIVFAWELVTEVYGIDADRLWVTVLAGDGELQGDEQAEELWRERIGVPGERLRSCGRKDNFWQMGETGPAGPCSELHYDQGPDLGCGRPECDPSCDCDRFLELWNLVFMQYDLRRDGSMTELPKPCVDTGAGLERFAAVLQGHRNNYETDLFLPTLEAVAAAAGVRYGGGDAETDVSLRVVGDHLRAVTFLIADGVLPGPEKRGAVLRRILRRAIRHGKRLGFEGPFLAARTGEIVERMGGSYPELFEARRAIEQVTAQEEEKFARTLSTGLDELESLLDGLAQGATLPGGEAFRLESERGVPMDLIRDAVEERGFAVDEEGYRRAREQHAEVSRAAVRSTYDVKEVSPVLREIGSCPVAFRGYEGLIIEETEVVALLRLSETPFYAEGGGQVGDRGLLVGDRLAVEVADTRSPLPGLIVHRVSVLRGALRAGMTVKAEVDPGSRRGAMAHHTATHLLHAALRELLGTHVRQRGSLVTPDRLRFDFSHFAPVDRGAARDIEQLVNEKIREDIPVEPDEMDFDDALAAGALAFFGDKYADRVRVVRIGDFSLELCGGTHVTRTGEIGLLTLAGERGVSAGVRRVEARAGEAALARVQDAQALLREVEQRVGADESGLLEGLERRMERARTLERENEGLRLRLVQSGGGQGGDEAPALLAGVPVLARRVDGLGRSEARSLADSLRQRHRSVIVVLGREEDGKAALLVAATPDLQGRLHAGRVVRRLAEIVGGRGGGRPDLAEAGGKRPERLDEALSPETLTAVIGDELAAS